MVAVAPVGVESYAATAPLLLAALPRRLQAPPLRLLGLTATLYLRPYLGAAEYRAAMHAALQRARAEASSWSELPGVRFRAERGAPPARGNRVELYRSIWRRAIAGGTGWHLVLAQHACEISELLDRPLLQLGRVLPTGHASIVAGLKDGAPVLSSGAALELLSRALLAYRIDLTTFVDVLLALHAGNRAAELCGGWTGPQLLAAQLVAGLPACDRSPRRLRAAQPHELALRAVRSGSARAALAVEAGLTEAEQLANGRRLLLLAALDRAVTANESDDDRY